MGEKWFVFLVFVSLLCVLVTPLFMSQGYWLWRFANLETDCGINVCFVDMVPIIIYGFGMVLLFSLYSLDEKEVLK